MNTKTIRIFSQNVHRNKILTETILEERKLEYNVIFIQESPWYHIWQVPSHLSLDGEAVIEALHNLVWTLFVQTIAINDDQPRTLTYVNNRLSTLRFTLQTDILDNYDINLTSFSNRGITFFLLNMYSDNHQNTLTYIKNTETNLNDILIMTGDFNIRDSDWDPSFPYHSLYTESLLEIADGLGL